MIQTLRFAARQLLAAPGFCLAVIITLALGIGVNTAVFSVLDGFLLRQLPYPEPDRVGALATHSESFKKGNGQMASEENDRFDGSSWQALKDSLTDVTIASYGSSSGVNLRSDFDGAVRYVRESRVSARYFDVLGIPLYRGRSFSESEDRSHGPPVVVLGYALWKSTFHGDGQIVGKIIHLKGEPYTVVGVLPANATVPSKADLFTALQPSTSGECGGENCRILLRLKPGVSWHSVDAQLRHIRFPFMDGFEKETHGTAWVYARPLQTEFANGLENKVSVLMLAVGCILLIACANLAGLTLVRISRREQELATRLALGASRWIIVRQLWAENLVLALFGGAVGVGCSLLILRVFENTLPESMIPMGGLSLNAHVLAFAIGATLLTSLLFGALPALQIRGVDLRSSIASGSRTLARTSGPSRQLLIIGEVALTVVLLAAAGLMIRTLVHLESQPPGFDPHDVITGKASLDDARYRDTGAFQALLSRSVAAMRAIPGVEEAAVGLSVPYELGLNAPIGILDGKHPNPGAGSSLSYVTPGYFAALRIPLLAGRLIAESDTASSQPIIVVNEAFGKEFFHEAMPIGRHIRSRIGDRVYMIVGVVRDVAKKPGMEPTAPIANESVYYVPATQMDQGLVNLSHVWLQPSWIVRSHGWDRTRLTQRMQQALASIDPNLPFSGFYSMDELLKETLQQQRIEVLLLTMLAGLALLLSAIGIYALVSNSVVQRTREIGIRIALGSTISQAMVHIGSSGFGAAAAGVACGIGLSFLVLRVFSSEIYGVQVYDPVTLITVPLLLVCIAALASLLPTLRITRLQPADTLRVE